jgi:hypothetical protein
MYNFWFAFLGKKLYEDQKYSVYRVSQNHSIVNNVFPVQRLSSFEKNKLSFQINFFFLKT